MHENEKSFTQIVSKVLEQRALKCETTFKGERKRLRTHNTKDANQTNKNYKSCPTKEKK